MFFQFFKHGSCQRARLRLNPHQETSTLMLMSASHLADNHQHEVMDGVESTANPSGQDGPYVFSVPTFANIAITSERNTSGRIGFVNITEATSLKEVYCSK